jgi:hypothetical protein
MTIRIIVSRTASVIAVADLHIATTSNLPIAPARKRMA